MRSDRGARTTRRSPRARVTGSRVAKSSEVTSSTATATKEKQLKFYLQRDAPVEDAPSIGPRTAEHLSRVQIVTVRDLLDADVETAAAELNHRRIKPQTLREWQEQAALVCRIPELRGHDAQILVAIEVTTPESLVQFRPADLFAKVAPFVNTPEGERIVRNGKKPDLEEVTFWIECAKQSRTLHAA